MGFCEDFEAFAIYWFGESSVYFLWEEAEVRDY